MKAKTQPARGRTSGHAGSLLDIEGLSTGDITSILKEAGALQKAPPRKLAGLLTGKRVALLFYEASTRTRVSFEFAAKTLGAHTTIVTSSASSIEKGESLLDTGYTLQALGAAAIVMRHPSSGAAQTLASHLAIPVINAGDGMHEHPTQALLDAFTISQHRSLKGLRITIVGDIVHSRVARSNIQLLSRFGAEITLCGPVELLPELAASLAPVKIERDFDRAARGAHVIMMLRVQKERLAGLNIDAGDYAGRYQVTVERLKLADKNVILMHPGPIVRGMEISNEVADGRQSVIVDQVRNGVAVRMAVLLRALRKAP